MAPPVLAATIAGPDAPLHRRRCAAASAAAG